MDIWFSRKRRFTMCTLSWDRVEVVIRLGRLVCTFVVCKWHKQAMPWGCAMMRLNFDNSLLFFFLTVFIIWATSWENLSYAICKQRCRSACASAQCKQQSADQPAHLYSLISTFVVSCLDSTLKTKSNFTAYIYMKKLFNSHFSSEIMGIFIRFSCHALSEEVQTNLR